MQKFNVFGMSCAACSSKVEKAVSKVRGVKKCSVNLLTGSMEIEGDADKKEIIEEVKKAGYSAVAQGEKNFDEPKKSETAVLLKRFLYSLGFLLVLMYFSMGYAMFGAPLPAFFDLNPVRIALMQFILSAIILIINKKFFINGVKGILHGAPNMDTLVSLGSGASFVYSTVILFLMSGNMEKAHHFLHELYFESAAMILVLITVGKMLEAFSKGKTTNAIKSLMSLAPKTAIVLVEGKEVVCEIEKLKKGDIFIIKAGSSIPADGTIIEGEGSADEGAVTGESIPVEKTVGQSVISGTRLLSGYIKCRADKVGEDTTLSLIIKMVSDAASSKAPVAKAADRVSAYFVPSVLVIGLISVIVWLMLGESVGFALARGISVLVISCPCALGLATPVAIMVGSGVGAKHGILFKNARALEETGRAQTVALDKTGTITKGKPEVTDIIPFGASGEKEALKIAYSLEVKSEHPLSKAIADKAEAEGIVPMKTESFDIFQGGGVKAFCEGEILCGGNYDFVSKYAKIEKNALETAERLSKMGKTAMFFSKGDTLSSVIAVADDLRDDSINAIKELSEMGIKTVMITGDNEKTAREIAKRAGIKEVFASVLPSGKEDIIRKLKKDGKVIMVGDGINDAPALTRADIGIAIGAGEDIAIDAAEVVLMKNKLSDVSAAIKLSRATLKNIYENLFWAFIYNIFGIPLAAGAFIEAFGWKMSPMFGAAAMSVSSFCVVMNALRLNFADIKNPHKYNKRIVFKKRKAERMMKVTLKIEGMMCMHCEGRVKSTLEGMEGVEEALVSHETGTAEITAKEGTNAQALADAVTAQGYKVLEIK